MPRFAVLLACVAGGFAPLPTPALAAEGKPRVIANSDSPDKASFVAPNEPGKQVHIILEVTDNGTPELTGYQRVICHIK